MRGARSRRGTSVAVVPCIMSNAYVSTTSRTVVLSLGLLGLAVGDAPVAHASCAVARFELVWSWPADGDTNVPLDATMQLLTSKKRVGSWAATLNDQPLDSDSADSFALGGLQPDTDYTFRIVSTDMRIPTEMPEIAVHFRTGAASGGVVPAPKVAATRLEEEFPLLSERCQATLGAQSCWDTGPAKYRTFDIEDSSAVAYLVSVGDNGYEMLWPVDCEPIASELQQFPNDEPICYRVRAVDARGERSEATQLCLDRKGNSSALEQAQQQEQGSAAPAAASCSTQRVAAAQTSGWLGSVLGLLLTLGLLRRRSGRAGAPRRA
jgi:hypothetical protein